MLQQDLWHEDINDAIAADIMACGGYKKMALELWPALKMETAYARLKACLNHDKAEKLSPEEISLITRMARQRGSLATLTYMLREAHCADPAPIEPEDEKARLQREYVASVKALQKLSKQLEKLA
ncbi:MAG: hypothetical protein ACNA75_06260 [Thiohalomonadaceae bacterium]